MLLKPKNMQKFIHSITALVLVGGLLGFSAEAFAAETTQTTFSKASTSIGHKKPKKHKTKAKKHKKCEAYNG